MAVYGVILSFSIKGIAAFLRFEIQMNSQPSSLFLLEVEYVAHPEQWLINSVLYPLPLAPIVPLIIDLLDLPRATYLIVLSCAEVAQWLSYHTSYPFV